MRDKPRRWLCALVCYGNEGQFIPSDGGRVSIFCYSMAELLFSIILWFVCIGADKFTQEHVKFLLTERMIGSVSSDLKVLNDFP